MTSESPDPIEALKRRLDKPGTTPPPLHRSSLPAAAEELPSSWSPPPSRLQALTQMTFLKKILYTSVIFFVLMAVIAAWAFFRGDNVVRTGNVELLINAPASSRAGEEVALEVSLVNKNSIPLEFVDLIMKYPPGTRLPGASEETTRDRRNLGTIDPGDEKKESFKVILFGEKGSKIPLSATLEYRLADSNAIFDKTTIHEVEISDAPISLRVEAPTEINAGQDLKFEIEVQSNAKTDLSGAILSIVYPTGFNFRSATPKPTNGNGTWALPKLAPGQKLAIELVGALAGQNEEQKTFRFEAGLPDTREPSRVGILYDAELATLALRRSNVDIALAVGGNTASEQVVNSRQLLQTEFRWTNNLPDDLEDVELELIFDGNALDPLSVSAGTGFFQSDRSKIIWNEASDSKLKEIEAGDDGEINFSFSTPALGSGSNVIKNPELVLKGVFKGHRVVARGDGDTELVTAEVIKRIKVNSAIQLAAKALYYSDLLPATGPLPPKVGEETVYTIVWSIVNTSNDVRDVEVRATLPPYMRWVGEQKPGNESLVFNAVDSGGGEIIWKVGTVRPGIGFTTAPREVAFQVGLTPGLGQRGQSPVLLDSPVLSGVDTFTNQTLSLDLRRDLDTYLTSDPQFKIGEDKVVE